MRFVTRSPNQRLAALCCLIAAVVGIVVSTAASLPILAVGLVFAMRARNERR
jgi:O-antigen ligase